MLGVSYIRYQGKNLLDLAAAGSPLREPRCRPHVNGVVFENSIRLRIRVARPKHRIRGRSCSPALIRKVHRRFIQVAASA
jgi:hypothetical protein